MIDLRRYLPWKGRDAPSGKNKRSGGILVTQSAWETLIGGGYKALLDCPEVQTCIGIYAELIASMTIYLKQNTDKGDRRVRNGLSRKLDIDPHPYLTRHDLMSMVTSVLIARGNQVTYPMYKNGFLEALIPFKPSQVSFVEKGDSYQVRVNGFVFDPDEVLHFKLKPNPERPFEGLGFTVILEEVVKSLRQTNSTKQSILESPAPSVIVKVDGLTEDFSSSEGRKALTKQYLESAEDGRPWLIPAEAFEVEQVKPLSLTDLAIKDSLELDKKAIASIMGVPAFMLGVGKFDRNEYNWFITNKLMPMAQIIEQELTRKLLESPDLYWHLNSRSLMAYSMDEIVKAGQAMVDRMALRRNEWRDWVGMDPDPEMEELLALENFIPADRLGDQKKLNGSGEEGDEDEQEN